ncbi:crAss001_48 related protein [Vreelandella venusta]|uniref:crAss001_48 related protein n=1 Tax=Vreelandella venusta TaxID=44935 RepID=UPI0018DA9E50|nr:hypothetical protein [Halomonas venusta]QPI62403.1 hypothetical protein IR195_10875 [Halomonas venusta]
MQPHQQRVVTEKEELDKKILALDGFIGGDIFSGLDKGEKDRLVRQYKHMSQYSAVLGERISHF